MRFESETPTSRLLGMAMPWMKGRRPAWLIRLGLFLYDHLGGRRLLPATRTIDLATDPAGDALKPEYRRAYEYSDCWVEDSRLVVLNARDAADRGARILTRTRVVSADRRADHWAIELEDAKTGSRRTSEARFLVNAGGPWVGNILRGVVRSNSRESVRLVRGSHVVTRRLFDHDRCYFFQGTDGRIIFAIPYEGDFTLIGTTDAEHDDPSAKPECTPEERRYLLDFASRYFRKPVTEADVAWSFSGVRPLYDDGAKSATAATRDYVLSVDDVGGAPLLSVFGGKITTYRRLAEAAMAKVADHIDVPKGAWTAGSPLPGGDFPHDGAPALVRDLQNAHPFLSAAWAARLVRAYGRDAEAMLAGATRVEDLGEMLAHDVTAREIDWAMDREWVRSAEDFLWRRTKLGLKTTEKDAARIDAYVLERSRRLASV